MKKRHSTSIPLEPPNRLDIESSSSESSNDEPDSHTSPHTVSFETPTFSRKRMWRRKRRASEKTSPDKEESVVFKNDHCVAGMHRVDHFHVLVSFPDHAHVLVSFPDHAHVLVSFPDHAHVLVSFPDHAHVLVSFPDHAHVLVSFPDHAHVLISFPDHAHVLVSFPD